MLPHRKRYNLAVVKRVRSVGEQKILLTFLKQVFFKQILILLNSKAGNIDKLCKNEHKTGGGGIKNEKEKKNPEKMVTRQLAS